MSEPPPTQADLHFSLFGFPVRISPWFWGVSILMGIRSGGPQELLTWVGVVFVSILVHELGHALAMRYFGWNARITLYAFGGMAAYESNSAMQQGQNSPRSQILISLAGPAAGFVLAGLVVAAIYATNRSFYFFFTTIGQGPYLDNPQLILLVRYMLFVNVLWGLVNLLPVYPLDGGQVSRELFMLFNPRRGIVQSLWLSVIASGAAAVFGLMLMESLYVGLMFGFLAYSSYQTLQAYLRGGYGGGRGW
ncbi:MAG: site-2 protease family protein [Planctomycetes bacterium]|nr:site-2 protease family protein [Planctomycetota bacterium]